MASLLAFSTYTYYTSETSPAQVYSSASQAPKYGSFLEWYNTNDAASAASYTDFVSETLQRGAFVSRFHAGQIRHLDAASYFMLTSLSSAINGISPGTNFATSSEWTNLVSNTTYMFEHLSDRIRRMDAALDLVFATVDLLSASSQSLNYLSSTEFTDFYGLGSTSEQLPVSLTGTVPDFDSQTFGPRLT